MESKPHGKIGNYLGIAGSVVSLLMTVVYFTWEEASFEKRIALVEQQQNEVQANETQIRSDLDKDTMQQNTDQANFETDMHSQIAQLSTRIEQIYQILLSNTKTKLG
jgi:hypothetical protein